MQKSRPNRFKNKKERKDFNPEARPAWGKRNNRKRDRVRRSPVSDIIRVKIEDLNERAEGVAFYKTHKLSVKKVLPGEKVVLTYHPDNPPKDRIRLDEIVEPSPTRVEPPCPYFEECGACHVQHMEYGEQLRFKENLLKRLRLSSPLLRSLQVEPVVGMPEPSHYRNKTQMPFENQDGSMVYGLYRKGTHDIIPINYCLVENKDANQVLQTVKDWAELHSIPIYDEVRHTGTLRHVLIRKGFFTNQVMVIVVSRESELPHWKELVQALKMVIPTLRSVQININPDRTNHILGRENLLAWGDPFISEQVGKIRFRIYPNTFFQTNSVQTVKLLETISREAGLNSNDHLLDLYCGVGTIGLYLASQVKEVVGIENNEDAVLAAEQNAGDNEIFNTRFFNGNAENGIRNILPDKFQPDVVVVDPPRKGLSERLTEELLHLRPQKIVYVSCSPKTLMRDLEALVNGGYTAGTVHPFDMFPQTTHVESMVILQRTSE